VGGPLLVVALFALAKVFAPELRDDATWEGLMLVAVPVGLLLIRHRTSRENAVEQPDSQRGDRRPPLRSGRRGTLTMAPERKEQAN
jgi:hypothetical protein